jgi:hypothetical protein
MRTIEDLDEMTLKYFTKEQIELMLTMTPITFKHGVNNKRFGLRAESGSEWKERK